MRHLLEAPREASFASTDSGLRGYKARYHLGVLYGRQGRSAEAENELRRVVKECPGFLPGWERLGEIYSAQGRCDDLRAVEQQMKRLQGKIHGTRSVPTTLERSMS